MELASIKGLGPKTIKALNHAGINDSYDLVSYYPYKYRVLSRSQELVDGEVITIDGTLETSASIFFFGKHKDRMTFKLNTGTRLLKVTVFNRGYLKNKLVAGTSIYIIGKYDERNSSVVATDLSFGLLPDHEVILPIYHNISGVSNKQLQTFMNEILRKETEYVDVIPSHLREKYKLDDVRVGIKNIHMPKSQSDLKRAINRVKYEELFLFMLKMNYLKESKNKDAGLKREIDFTKVEHFINDLPFELTLDQKKCVQEIYDDLTRQSRMNRLVQGDVGSGKTIVSFLAMYMNYLGGYQSALMAPTEILALQHYDNLVKLFKDYPLNIGVLTGKTKAKERQLLLSKLSSGEVDILVGTHAILSSDLSFSNLGLVVTDEQHRFGVNQRRTLKNKGITPDILYMSATPIPRTYALTLYGDMDVSNIHTMPIGRKPVITKVKQNADIKEVLQAMLGELKRKHQIYVVAPMIEENEDSSNTNVQELYSNMEKAFGKYYHLGLLHGKMKNKEKEEVMNAFKENQTQILISTTVIEVGLDVGNATMIVIFNSERFGLSTLHQLRGRVGRNSLDSYCYLISDQDKERLHILEKTNDGFEVSAEDFRLRGSGDLFGYRQSGDMVFKMADIKKDFNILMHAKEDSLEFLKSKEYQNNLVLRELIEKNKQLD